MIMIVCKISYWFLYLTTPNIKNSDNLAGKHFIFLKKHSGPNLKVFQYQIWTSVKSLEKQFPSKTKFNMILQLSCSNFALKLS